MRKRKSHFRKGRPKTGGRKKGVPNHVTADVRAAIQRLAEDHVHNVDKWLRRVGRKNPGKAAELFFRMIEYHIPKLQRVDHTGDLTHKHTYEYSDSELAAIVAGEVVPETSGSGAPPPAGGTSKLN